MWVQQQINLGDYFSSKMWYVGRQSSTCGHCEYLRNDGVIFPTMQTSASDLNGGTYHLAKEDAEASLNRYLQGKNNG